MFFDRGTFWVLPSIYFYLPKSARACLFPRLSKFHYFCSGPTSADPIFPQTKALFAAGGAGGAGAQNLSGVEMVAPKAIYITTIDIVNMIILNFLSFIYLLLLSFLFITIIT